MVRSILIFIGIGTAFFIGFGAANDIVRRAVANSIPAATPPKTTGT
jgi:hypothetical protein